jgi:dipeptidyl aminopeptidase/acylaminoacyl peptidase
MGLYRQFFGIDLESRREFPLFDAPTGEYVPPDGQLKVAASTPMNAWPTAAEAFWSEDGRQAIVVNTALPLTEAASDERTAMSYIVSYNWDAGSWRVLEPMHQASGISVKTVGWLQPGRELLVTHQRDGERAAGTVYSLRGDSWKARSVGTDVVLTANPERSKRLAKGLLVRVKGDENEPTSIIASQSGRQIVLTPPDPALDGLWWARNRRVEWQDAGGTKHVGGLLLPRKSDRPPPLVIQVGYYITDRFLPDGPFSTGYAAQALVAQGMAVLQFATPMKEAGNYRELEEFRAAWESAVESLSRQGLIDSQRVALTGFSHFGNLTYHAITHPGRIPLAAAVVTDSNTSSYLLYLTYNATGSFDPKSLERLYGGPFWGAKTSWLERETTFNVDRVKTPVLFVGGSSSFTVETIGAFKANRKTFEFLLMPDAPHQLERPRQREASIAATTDWMSFWLMGHEDPSESKADQYVRWRSLRAEHQAKRSPE